MTSVRVSERVGLVPDVPVRLFPTSLAIMSRSNRPYDVTSDGKRFLMPVPTSGAFRETLHLVTNWTARLPQ